MKKIKFFTIVFMLIFSTYIQAQSNASYMIINGASQGLLVGDVLVPGQEGSFEINELHHLIQTTGITSHEPLIVTTPMSKSVPFLFKALDDNELLTVTISYLEFNPSGTEILQYTINMINAKLIAIEPIMLNNNIPENVTRRASVRLRFSYTSIIQRYDFGGPDEQVISLTNSAAVKK